MLRLLHDQTLATALDATQFRVGAKLVMRGDDCAKALAKQALDRVQFAITDRSVVDKVADEAQRQ
jgi:hypothetical protein